MVDLKERREKFLADAADCELISSLAADAHKRDVFRQLAEDLRKMVRDMDAAIAARDGKNAA